MPPEEPEIVYGFFCEHVRDEVSGKTTAIGIWGDLCRILVQPPASMPFGFHAYVRNRARLQIPVKVSLRIPGAPPIELRSQVTPTAISVGTNLNLNFVGASFTESGRIVATVSLELDPPIVREFDMEVRFEPPVTTAVPR